MNTLFYYDAAFLQHDTGQGHPECAARLNAILQAIETVKGDTLAFPALQRNSTVSEHIRLIHNAPHIEEIFNNVPDSGFHIIDGDTRLSPGSLDAALLAVSAACNAVDQVMQQSARNAFCCVRPPGHHATPERAMGFCLFNNIAIAAAYARKQYQLQRISIVDFDVHHGNGTQAAFWEDRQVQYISSHEMPNYPGTGYASETGCGNIINIPLQAGCDGKQFRQYYLQQVFPAIRDFKPDLLLLSAGFDAHKLDPLSSIQLVEDDYAWLTTQLLETANDCCNGKVVSMLEGGYHLEALAASVAAHVGTLINSA